MDITWVVSDYNGTAGTRELTVHKGQQVEIIEVSTSSPDMCLVRLLISGGDAQPEGLVPLSILKQLPAGRLRSAAGDGSEHGKKKSCVVVVQTFSAVESSLSRCRFAPLVAGFHDFHL